MGNGCATRSHRSSPACVIRSGSPSAMLVQQQEQTARSEAWCAPLPPPDTIMAALKTQKLTDAVGTNSHVTSISSAEPPRLEDTSDQEREDTNKSSRKRSFQDYLDDATQDTPRSTKLKTQFPEKAIMT